MKRITLISTIGSLAFICFIIIIIGTEHCDECFSAPVMAIKFLICGLIIIIGSILFKTKYIKIESIIFDIESEPLRETEEAVDEVPFAGKGNIESEDDTFINSPYTNTPCVYFHSIKEELVRKGKSGEREWVIVENIASFVPFHLKDEKGILKIDLADVDYDFSQYKIPLFHENISYPKNSEIDCEAVLKNKSYTEKQEGFFNALNSKEYRMNEFVLRSGTTVFAYGFVSDKNGQLMLHENEKHPLIITQKSREKYIEEFYRGSNLIYFSHVLLVIGYTILIFSLNYFLNFYPSFFLQLLLIGNLIILGSTVFSLYNRVITLKQRALGALSNIEIDLKRRGDLIPNLVEIIKGYSKHEGEIQKILTEIRSKIVFSKEIPKEEKPIVNSLVTTIENYPFLRVSEQFQSLMNTLVDTEGRIAHSREFYNRSVRKYNTLISQFPFFLISFPLGIKEMNFISISRGEVLI